MSTFVQQAACRGHRPAQVVPRQHQSRSEVVARLLQNRAVPRFLVAPGGFGKTMLAYEYAEVVFGFSHVFWLNGLSPCFLRDLDAGTLVDDLWAADENCSLVVFEDVPLLLDERAEAFSGVIDRLVGRGCEVLVTMTPFCDSLGSLQRDRVLLTGFDLLLNDEEAARNGRGEPTGHRAPFALEERIACLQWGDEGSRVLLEGCRQEALPLDLAFVVWAILVLQQGTWHDIAEFVGEGRAQEAWEVLACAYPYLGMSESDGSFASVGVSPAELEAGLGGLLGGFVEATRSQSADEMVQLLAASLIERGRAKRAVRLMESFASRSRIPAWLLTWGWRVLWDRAAVEFCELYESVSRDRIEERSTVNAMLSWGYAQVKDARRSLDFAKRALAAETLGPESRLTALVVSRTQGNAMMVRRMDAEFRRWKEETASVEEGGLATGKEEAQSLGQSVQEDSVPGALEGNERGGSLEVIARVALARERFDVALSAWSEVRSNASARAFEDEAGSEPWLLAAAWVLEALASAEESEGASLSLEQSALLDDLLEFCHGALESRLGRGWPLGFGSMQAAEALDRLEGFLEARRSPVLAPVALVALRQAQIELARDREEYRVFRRRRQPRTALGSVGPLRDRGSQTMKEAWRDNASKTLGVPLLHVRLFGSFAVYRGDQELPAQRFTRRKMRLLLALLALNRGRDLTRDGLAVTLWPETQAASGAKNFYRLWHDLEAALSFDGSCPYLVRDRDGCRLDPALFTTDVTEFEDLTRHLLFGDAAGFGSWKTLYEKVAGPFSGDLLPLERDNDTICALRSRFAIEMIDSLIAASRHLRLAGEPQGALWFAREALQRDATREDAYAVLMEAQMAAGQRTAALDTFFSCRTYLSETLGLDPSTQLMVLYQTLLEDDVSPEKITF